MIVVFLGWHILPLCGSCLQFGSGQEIYFGLSKPHPGRNAGQAHRGPHLGTWMGLKLCKTKHTATLDGTPSDSAWDLEGQRIGPRHRFWIAPLETAADFQAFLSILGAAAVVLAASIRYRPKGVFGKGVGNSQNASEMRQKCVKMGLVLLRKEERPKCVRNPSKLRQKCVKNALGRTPFGRYRSIVIAAVVAAAVVAVSLIIRHRRR